MHMAAPHKSSWTIMESIIRFSAAPTPILSQSLGKLLLPIPTVTALHFATITTVVPVSLMLVSQKALVQVNATSRLGTSHLLQAQLTTSELSVYRLVAAKLAAMLQARVCQRAHLLAYRRSRRRRASLLPAVLLGTEATAALHLRPALRHFP